MRTYYHATPYSNLLSIINNGINKSIDGIVYMTESEEDAVKFPYVHGCRDILTLKIKIPKSLENNVVETFDHSEQFFKCRCFGFIGDVTPDMIEPSRRYNI